jgi:tRNA modification GTPase
MAATIFALSTPRGRGGLAVVRMSGGEAADILRELAGELPPPRHAVPRVLADPASGEIIDHALVLYFRAPASVTGEDVVEFHLHGGNAVTAALLKVLGRQLGCRMAQPGEFTRRAF